MKNLNTSDWIAISGFFLVIVFLSLWAIDISVTAMLSNGFLTNGFFYSNPAMIYHIGLYLISLTCFLNFLMIIHLILKSKSNVSTENTNTISKIHVTKKRIKEL